MKPHKSNFFGLRFLYNSATSAVVCVCCSSLARADYASEIMSENPLAYYRFNDGVATESFDTSTNLGSLAPGGNGLYSSTFVHSVTGALAGSSNTAGKFANNGFTVPYAASLNNQGSFTMEAWIKPASIPNGTDLFCPMSSMHPADPRAGWIIYHGNADTGFNFRTYNQNGTNTAVSINSGAGITAGAWYHVAVVWDNAASVGKIYVNGVLKATSPTTTYVANPDSNLTLGSRSDNAFGWSGDMDEPAYYDKALSDAQILAHYNNGIDPAPATNYKDLVQADGPVGYWRLDESTLVQPVADNAASTDTAANGAYYAGAKNTNTGPNAAAGFLGFGATNSALSLQNADGYVGTALPLLNNRAAFTLTGWLKRGATHSTNGGYFGQNDLMEFGDSGGTSLAAWSPNSGTVSANYSIPDDTWGMVTITSDGTGTKLYVDGNSVGTAGPANLATSAYMFNIGGGIWTPSGQYFRGDIDEVAVLDKALTPARVKQLYDAAKGNVLPVATVSLQPGSPVMVGESYTLTCSDPTGTPPFTYQWQRDGVDIPSATAPSYTVASAALHTPAGEPFVYTVKISNPATAPTVPGEDPFTTDPVSVYVANTQYWIGTNPTHPDYWDIGTTNNWAPNDDGTGTPARYYDYSPVVFNDAATGTNIAIQADVTPASVVFENDTKPFTVSGMAITGDCSLTKNGAANVTLNANNYYEGGTIVNAGTLTAGAPEAFGPAGSALAFDIASTGKVRLNGNSMEFGTLNSIMTETDAVVVESGSATAGSDELLVSGTPNSGFSGILQNGGNRLLSLAKEGSGTLTLTGTNTYSGTTTIEGGILQIGNGGTTGSIGAGEVTNNAVLQFQRSGSMTLANTIVGNGKIHVRPDCDLTFSGSVTCDTLRFDQGGNRSVRLTGSTPNTIQTVTDHQDGHGSLFLAKDSGVNAFSGSTLDVGSGYASQFVLQLENDEQISDTTVVKLYGWDGAYGGKASFRLNGHNETIAGLSDGSNESYVQNNAATPSVLTLAGPDTYSVRGGVNDGTTGTLSIIKSGTGTQTLQGDKIDYNGSTTVSNGRLILLNNDDTWTSGYLVAAGAFVEVNRNTATTYEHRNTFTLSGAGTFEKTGDGTIDMNWDKGGTIAMASGGHIHVKTGTLRLGYGAMSVWTANLADLTIEAGATFDLWDNNNGGVFVDALNGGGSIVRSTYAQTGTLTVGVDGGSGSFSGTINNATGTTHLVKQGGGTQTLAGVIAYSGDTTVAGGALSVSLPSTFADGAAIRLASGTTLNLASAGTDVVNALYLNGTQTAGGKWGRIGSIAALGAEHESALITGDGLLNVTTSGSPTAFGDWATTHNVTGGMAGDDDNDGVSNLMEFATNSDPKNGGAGARVYTRVYLIGGTEKAFTYTVATRAGSVFAPAGSKQTATKDGVTYTIEATSDFVTWGETVTELDSTTSGSVQGGMNLPTLDTGWEWHTFRTADDIASDSKDFIRLKVTEP